MKLDLDLVIGDFEGTILLVRNVARALRKSVADFDRIESLIARSLTRAGALWYDGHRWKVDNEKLDLWEASEVLKRQDDDAMGPTLSATGEHLDRLGAAWGVIRTNNESDQAYRERIRRRLA